MSVNIANESNALTSNNAPAKVKLLNGSVINPSLTFETDQKLGIYKVSNGIGVCNNSIQIGEIRNSRIYTSGALQGSSAVVDGEIDCTTGTITTLGSTWSTLTNMNVTTGTITTLGSTNLTATNAGITNLTTSGTLAGKIVSGRCDPVFYNLGGSGHLIGAPIQ